MVGRTETRAENAWTKLVGFREDEFNDEQPYHAAEALGEVCMDQLCSVQVSLNSLPGGSLTLGI